MSPEASSIRSVGWRTWAVYVPDSDDGRLWVADEHACDWHAWPAWTDRKGRVQGAPGRPWPQVVDLWCQANRTPYVVPLTVLAHPAREAWWRGLVWNDVRQMWLLGWEPTNHRDLPALWAKTSLENRLLALEKAHERRWTVGVGPDHARYARIAQATIDELAQDPEQPALLAEVVRDLIQSWRTAVPPSETNPLPAGIVN